MESGGVVSPFSMQVTVFKKTTTTSIEEKLQLQSRTVTANDPITDGTKKSFLETFQLFGFVGVEALIIIGGIGFVGLIILVATTVVIVRKARQKRMRHELVNEPFADNMTKGTIPGVISTPGGATTLVDQSAYATYSRSYSSNRNTFYSG